MTDVGRRFTYVAPTQGKGLSKRMIKFNVCQVQQAVYTAVQQYDIMDDTAAEKDARVMKKVSGF